MEPDHLSVVARVGNEQDQAPGAQIALLRRRFALDELDIPEMRFGLDQGVATFELERRIATSQIAGDRDRYFDSPSNDRAQARPKPGEQRQVTSITHRITTRMQRRREL